MKLGAEPKKIAIAVALLAVAGIVFWMNSSSDAPPATSTPRAGADPGASAATAPPAAEQTNKAAQRRKATGGHPSIVDNAYKPPDSVDPGKIDPTLRLDLLAKVQSIEVEGGVRNLFQFTQPPPPPPAVASAKLPSVPNIHPNAPGKPGVPTPPQPVHPAPGPPPAPPINLKYYGYSTKHSDGEKKAFFLDGEDIIVAAEGEIIKKQYKVVRIGTTSVQMEDTSSKTTQVLPIQQDAAPV